MRSLALLSQVKELNLSCWDLTGAQQLSGLHSLQACPPPLSGLPSDCDAPGRERVGGLGGWYAIGFASYECGLWTLWKFHTDLRIQGGMV